MACFRRERRGLGTAQIRALNHPLRLRILELHKRAGGRPLSVELLTEALSQTREYGHVKQAEVKYHRDRLLDAELLPTA
jgi:DNA-binding transcriptional ArsR family regulator